MTPFRRWRAVALASSATTVALALGLQVARDEAAAAVVGVAMLVALLATYTAARFAVAALRFELRDEPTELDERLQAQLDQLDTTNTTRRSEP